MRKIKSLFKGILICSGAAMLMAPVNVVWADGVNDKNVQSEVKKEDSVKIETIGLEESYATGDAVCFTIKVTNTSDKPIYAENHNGAKGVNGSISVSIKTKDGKYNFGENYRWLVSDGVDFSGKLESGQSIERDYTLYLYGYSGAVVVDGNTAEILKDYEGEFEVNVSFVYGTREVGGAVPYDSSVSKSFDFKVDGSTKSNGIPESIMNSYWGDESDWPRVAKKIETESGLRFWFVGLNREYNNDEQVYPAVCVTNVSDTDITIFSGYSNESGYIVYDIMSEDNESILEDNINKMGHSNGAKYTKELKPGESVTVLFSASIGKAKTGNYLLCAGLNSIGSQRDLETEFVSVPIKIKDVKNQGNTLQDKFKGKFYGDFDLDGKVSLKDAKKALRISLGIDEATEDESYVGNINGKGITLNEAKSFLRMSLGIENSRAIV